MRATKILLEDFAFKVDTKIQNQLMTELMVRYSMLSKDMEESNRALIAAEEKLKKYNEHLQELVDEKVNEISDSQLATIYALVKLSESRDGETGAHIERTSGLCRLLALKLSSLTEFKKIIDEKFLDNIYKSSPLHDIGKVGIRDDILLKPGKLTHDEFEIMKTHTLIGANTLSQVLKSYDQNEFLEMGMEIALSHHEKWDGTGYPSGLSGESIPLPGRIMALIDVYDALRSKRVYKEAYTHEKSCSIISDSKGRHFDPRLVEVFMQNDDEFRKLYDQISSQ